MGWLNRQEGYKKMNKKKYTYRLGWKVNGQWKYKRIATEDDLFVAIADIIAQAESISINKVKEAFRL